MFERVEAAPVVVSRCFVHAHALSNRDLLVFAGSGAPARPSAPYGDQCLSGSRPPSPHSRQPGYLMPAARGHDRYPATFLRDPQVSVPVKSGERRMATG